MQAKPPSREEWAMNSLAPAAAVNRDWQAFFEPIVFRSLVLEGEADVAVFRNLVQGDRLVRLGFIRHLRVHTVLPDYDRARCMEPEDEEELERHDHRLSRTLWPLLTTLGTWKAPEGRDLDNPRSPSSCPGLELELSAGSWSDTKYVTAPCTLSRTYPFETADDLGRAEVGRAYGMYRAMEALPWHTTRLSHPQMQGCAIRQYGVRPLFTSIRHAAPSLRLRLSRQPLDIVRSLVVRQRFRRAFDSQLLIGILELGRRSIHTLRIEMNNGHSTVIDGIFEELAQKQQNLALQSVHLIAMHPALLRPGSARERIERETAIAAVAPSVFQASRGLTHLTAIRYATADGFFSPAHAAAVQDHRHRRLLAQDQFAAFWPHLTTVSLETHSQWEGTQQGVQTLLRAAAMVREMPQLQILELCNNYTGDGPYEPRGHAKACFFRFEASSASINGHPCIVLGGNWDTRQLWTGACHLAWVNAVEETFAAGPYRPLDVEFRRMPLYLCMEPDFFAGPHHGTYDDHPVLCQKKIDPVTHSDRRYGGRRDESMLLLNDAAEMS